MINFTGTYTDQYQLKMAQVYFLAGHSKKNAVFDYFFRRLPFQGGYAVFAGLADLLAILADLRFAKDDLQFLKSQGTHPDFLAYLRDFRFRGSIYSCAEGEIVFPGSPILRVEAGLIEAQIIETLLLNIVNFQTLIATKASRFRLVAKKQKLVEFGLRRAQGPGGYYASRAAMVGGFDGTSNVCAARDYAIPLSGTMAHSFIQSYETEEAAFREFSRFWPDECVLLVDTYNTLESGLPNAIKIAHELQAKGHRLKGIRLDSGDLAYLAKKARQMLDDAGLEYVDILASNQLDEYVVKSLLEQKAPIDIFGVGTHLAVGHPDSALDGVYKLAKINTTPCIKISDNADKITLPDSKQVYRVMDGAHFQGADVIALADEDVPQLMYHPFENLKSRSLKQYVKEPLLKRVMSDGEVLIHDSLQAIATYSQQRLQALPEEYKRFTNPHIYKVGLSKELKKERDHLIEFYRGKSHESVNNN